MATKVVLIPYYRQAHERLAEGYEFKPFPAVVSQLLAELKDPDAKADRFANVIEQDIALASRILKLANSPLFGFAHELRSVRHAVTVLGKNSLKNMALSYVGASLFSDAQSCALREGLWTHSLACAVMARCIADTRDTISSDDAFLAGILHDVGKLFFLDVARENYVQAMAGPTEAREATERRLFGAAHDEIGFRLVAAWPLMDEVKAAIKFHHRPTAETVRSDLTAVVHVANYLVRFHGVGSVVDPFASVDPSLLELLGLTEGTIEGLTETALELYEETMAAYV